MAIGTGAYNPNFPGMTAERGASTFGHADYAAALASGKSNQEILNWVQKNFSSFSQGPRNLPGGGGLYDAIAAGASQESQAAAQRAATERSFNMQIQQQQRQEQAQAERLKQMEISERVKAANAARAGMESQFQIKSASKSPKTSGTQGFKRRQLQINPTSYNAISAGAQPLGVINV
jgi:hypothetical protein